MVYITTVIGGRI